MSAELIRPLVSLSIVAWLTLGLTLRKAGARHIALVAIGVLWMVVGIVSVDVLADRLDWWHYPGHAPRLGRTPADVLIVWAVAWGGLPLVATPVVRPLPAVAVFALVDVFVVPRIPGVVALEPNWWIGEVLLLAVVALPGLLLVRWMQDTVRLALRATLLAGLFTALAFWVIPLMAVELTDVPVDPPDWGGRGWFVAAQILAVPGVVVVASVVELVRRGGGTPYPWDPPRRVVSTGPYAYVANPMQLTMTIAYVVVAAALWHWPTLLAGAVAVAFSVGVADAHEQIQLSERWGAAWHCYRSRHRAWAPTWRPRFTDEPPARLYVDLDCGPCSALADWFRARHPVDLEVVPATDYPDGVLWRVTYRRGRTELSGIAAFAAALEHVHLGWAVAGWSLRLPGMAVLATLIMDATGNGPHPVGAASCAGLARAG